MGMASDEQAEGSGPSWPVGLLVQQRRTGADWVEEGCQTAAAPSRPAERY